MLSVKLLYAHRHYPTRPNSIILVSSDEHSFDVAKGFPTFERIGTQIFAQIVSNIPRVRLVALGENIDEIITVGSMASSKFKRGR
jgi:hypothetical protein